VCVAPTALGAQMTFSRPLRAGLTSAAPTALKKREVERAGEAANRRMLRGCRAYGAEGRRSQKSRRDAGAAKGDGGVV
jgi:hypothetical protein